MFHRRIGTHVVCTLFDNMSHLRFRLCYLLCHIPNDIFYYILCTVRKKFILLRFNKFLKFLLFIKRMGKVICSLIFIYKFIFKKFDIFLYSENNIFYLGNLFIYFIFLVDICNVISISYIVGIYVSYVWIQRTFSSSTASCGGRTIQ